MVKKHIELLAPAGSPAAYRAAAAAGADAVYLGAKGFNARQQADNFNGAELESVIEDAHARGIKVYFVLNTLIKNTEMEEACNLASFVYKKGIDAVIIQDLGLAAILRKCAPDLPLHASTQMTIHNTDGVKAAMELGMERIILSRENSINEIKTIVSETDAEIEVFVHGALCISRSGQCLLSSFIGGRSGNRGRCAQPCRLPWSTGAKNVSGGFLLSPRDLMTLEILPELIDTGISALKIEGRMKSPEYVAAVVSIYRKYLDLAIRNARKNSPENVSNNDCKRLSKPDEKSSHNNEPIDCYSGYKVDPEDTRMLMQVFNRGGFTYGYLKDYNFMNLMSTEHPKHWGIPVGTALSQEGIHQPKYGGNKEDRLIRIKLSDKISMGDGLEIWDSKNNNPSAIISVMIKDGSHVRTAGKGDILLAGNFRSEVTPYSMVYMTYDKSLMDSLAEMTKGNFQRVPVKGVFSLFSDEYSSLEIHDNDKNKVRVTGIKKAQKAKDRPITAERIEEQLKKTKDTPYFFESILIKTDNGSYIPVSEINSMRREALEKLTEKRKGSIKKSEISITPGSTYFPGNAQNLSKKREISLFFFNIPKRLNWEELNAGRVYIPLTGLSHLEAAKKHIRDVYIWLPAVLHDHQMDWVIKKMEPFADAADGVLAGNLGTIRRIRTEFPKMPVALDFQMNVLNSWTVISLETFYPASIAVSPELNIDEIRQMQSQGIPLEVYVYGEIPVMTMEYCPGSGGRECMRKCGACDNREGYITDRTGERFLYKTDPVLKRTALFNSRRLMLEDVSPLKNADVDILRIGIMNESHEDVCSLCDFYTMQWVHGSEKPVNNIAGRLYNDMERGFTRGHFFRGIE